MDHKWCMQWRSIYSIDVCFFEIPMTFTMNGLQSNTGPKWKFSPAPFFTPPTPTLPPRKKLFRCSQVRYPNHSCHSSHGTGDVIIRFNANTLAKRTMPAFRRPIGAAHISKTLTSSASKSGSLGSRMLCSSCCRTRIFNLPSLLPFVC